MRQFYVTQSHSRTYLEINGVRVMFRMPGREWWVMEEVDSEEWIHSIHETKELAIERVKEEKARHEKWLKSTKR